MTTLPALRPRSGCICGFPRDAYCRAAHSTNIPRLALCSLDRCPRRADRKSRMRTALRALGAGVLLVLGLTAGTRVMAEPALTLSACELEHPLRLTAVPAECGVLSVAENPQDPSGRHIGLHVARVPAISRRKQADPLFILACGPRAAARALCAT